MTLQQQRRLYNLVWRKVIHERGEGESEERREEKWAYLVLRGWVVCGTIWIRIVCFLQFLLVLVVRVGSSFAARWYDAGDWIIKREIL